jgi:hypothetical protein
MDKRAWNALAKWAEYGYDAAGAGVPPVLADADLAELATDAEAEIRADERDRELALVANWLEAEMKLAYGRRSYVVYSALRTARHRLNAGMHRTAKKG